MKHKRKLSISLISTLNIIFFFLIIGFYCIFIVSFLFNTHVTIPFILHGVLAFVGFILIFLNLIANSTMRNEYKSMVNFLDLSSDQDTLLDKNDYTLIELLTIVDSINDMIKRRKIAEDAIKKTEEQIELERDRAELANRAKSDFLASMSHEIRTPMNAILGFSDLLDFLIIDKKQKQYVQAIKTSGKSLLNLINDILDLSKIEAGRLEIHDSQTNLRLLFKEMNVMFYPKITEKGLEFNCAVNDNVPENLLLDENRIRQILVNIVGNAVKFTQTGYVTVSCNYFANFSKKDAGALVIEIKDSGIGIPKDFLQNIYTPFSQSDSALSRKHQGSGLGLSIVKKIIELMKGIIDVASSEGSGSVFTITIPAFEFTNPSTKIDTEEIPLLPFKNATILIADDIENNRILAEELLTIAGLHTISATDGFHALEILKTITPDLILLDIMMPGMDGFEVFKNIKLNSNLKNIPIIALTAQALKQDEEHIMSIGFSGYLRKPISQSGLYNEISKFLSIDYASKESLSSLEEKKPIRNQDSLLCDLNILSIKRDKCLQSARIQDYEDFANEIETIGINYNIAEMKSFAKDIKQLCKLFDIKSLRKATEDNKEHDADVKKSLIQNFLNQ